MDLSVRFEVDRRLPDKAIDLLKLAAAQGGAPSAAADGATADPDAADDDEDAAGEATLVRAESVARALAARRGLPLPLVLQDLAGRVGARLSTLEAALAERIVGQDEAIARSSAGCGSPSPLPPPGRARSP